jgi:levansucrase
MVLSAPISTDPNYRHGAARIRVMLEVGSTWHDLGHFMPDDLCPGQREWSGSAVYEPTTQRITLYYTVAGRRNDREVRAEQRLFEVSAMISIDAMTLTCSDWIAPREIIVADGQYYAPADGCDSREGLIKGFRDPGFFRDPADGQDYMLFTASKAQSTHDFNGVIGIAKASVDSEMTIWTSLPILLDADGLNNELERPHVVHHNGRYYLFWSTQQHMFAPEAEAGPTGLYGAVAESVLGPYQMLNGSGLVAANPADEPRQAYSWWVCDDLRVISFVDHWGLKGRPHNAPETIRAQFGGTIAPRFSLKLNGAAAEIEPR